MTTREGQISTQYIRKDHIIVTVLDVVNPAHFVVKESPTLNASSEAKSFLEAEYAMQKYYGSLEPSFFPLPLKDSIIVVLHEKKFYRAKVIRILTQSAGHLFRVYLVDYGVECSVPRECTFEIEKDFSGHPFQAVDVKLLGIEPISLVMNNTDLSMSYGPVTYWDPSAEIFIHDLQKEMCSVYLEVKAIDEQYLHGSIFICYDDNTVKCINDELISNAFAQFNNNCWEHVYKIDEVLENNSEKNSKKSDSTFGHVNPEQMPSPVSCSKVEPELRGLVTKFLSPDGKIISKSSFAKVDHSDSKPKVEEECLKLQVQEIHQTISSAVSKAVSPDQKVQEIHQTISPVISKVVSPNQKVQEIHQTISPVVSKAVSPNQKVQEIHQTISPVVSKAVSPNQKALNLNRIQKLQMLNRKKLFGIQSLHSDTSDRSTSLVENKNLKDVASDVTGVTNNSNELTITEPEKTTKIVSSCIDRNNDSDNLISHSDAENNVVCAALENKPRQECITEKDKIIAHKKFQKLQMLTRRKIQSQVSKNTVNKNSTITLKKIENEVNDMAISIDKINTIPNSSNIVKKEMSHGIEASNNMTNDCQSIDSSESLLQTQELDELPERSLKEESKSQVISKNLSTFQKLQQKVRNKRKQSNSSQELTDDLKNNEESSQMQACVVSPADCLNLSNTKEISLPSAISDAIYSSELKSALLNQHQGVGDIKEIKALIDENKKVNLKAIQKSNLIEDAIQISESKTPDLSPLKRETLSTEIKIVTNNTSSPIQQQKSSLLNKSVEKTSAYSANESESPISVSDASSEKSKKSPLYSKRSLELSSYELPPMEPQQSEILNELLFMSDSDDPLCSISTKKEERVCDKSHIEENYISLSTQLKHSDPRLIDFNELSLWEKQKIPALLIGIGLTQPILNVEQAKFSKHIFQVLKEINFYGPSCIQSVIWPSIEKNRCMIAIAPPHAGKTVSYVLPLVSAFTEEEVPKSNDNGPSTIILCSSWLKAQAVYDLFYFFLRNKKMSIIALCTDGGHYRNRVVSLINSCDILIATPYCLLQFLKDNSIKFDELENFILDDSTSLMNKHKKELKNILLSYLYGTKRSKNSPQLMLFAERWNKNFHVILDKMMSNPLIYFTSFLESAIFAKISIFVHVCQPEQKKNALLGIIKEAGKVVICTVSLQDAVDIHHFLRCEDVTTFLANEDMEHYIVDEVIKDWKSVKCTTTSHCLVITDQALINMCISNAACLVHYDIPPESRLQFGNRFSCIAEHFQKTKPACVSHILMTESEHYYAPQIVEIVENSGGTPPTDLIELCKKQNKVEDTLDLNDLCPYFKAFGFCKEHQCKNRHVVDAEKDKPQVIPYEGDIQGLVTHIVDASHYYIRLLKYLDPVSNKTVSLVSKYAEVGFLLRDYYSCAPAHLKVKSPIIGETYVLAEDNNLFYRIKVLKEFNSDPSSMLPSWKVLFLDEGWIKQFKKLELYELSDSIELPDPIAVEVYVCNITTPDSCFDWNPQTSQLVSDLIKGKEIHGKIALCLGKTLWLDPLILVSHLSNTNEYINLFKLNQKLLECGHARKNKNHLVNLHQACAGKVLLPNVAKRNIKEEKKVIDQTPEIHYAFLECNTYEDVYVSSVVSPHQLYVQRAKFVECLDNLLDKINEQVEKRTLKKAYSLHNGFHCIAPFHEDDRYYRAVITDIVSYNEVHLFYVDFGDSAVVSRNNIYCLPSEFLLLPFQAIECELAGIAAAHGGWTDSSVDALMTLTRDEAGDMKILQLQAHRKSSCYDGGNHYVIDLWFNEKNLSEQLLQAGFGIPVDAPISQPPPPIKLQDISSEPSSDEEFNLNERKISSDEEIDAEDKDAAALFYNYVAEMVLQANNLMPKPGATITEVSSDDEKCRSPSNETSKVACEKICKDLVQLLPKMNVGKNDGKQLEPLSTSHKPLIKWWDTPEQLNVLINLKEVKIYQLVVTDEGFSFNTIITGIQYSADEKLYDKIHSSDARKYQNCDGVNIIVKKHTPFKWPRLTKEKKKFLHITYDLIHIEDSDSDSKEKSSNVKKLKIRPEYAAADNYSSSTDEEEKYVEPWKDFAQQKSPFSAFD